MSNYLRVRIPGGLYFFTQVTLDRAPLFSDEGRVEILREAMRQVKSVRPFRIDAMVVLPEHLHCIWQLPDGDDDFSSRWREIKKAVSRRIDDSANNRNERPVWQRRFWEHLIRDEEDWRRHRDYIHYHPVKHGLVDALRLSTLRTNEKPRNARSANRNRNDTTNRNNNNGFRLASTPSFAGAGAFKDVPGAREGIHGPS